MKRAFFWIVALFFFAYFIAAFFTMRSGKKEWICRNLVVVIKDGENQPFFTESDIVRVLKNERLYPVNQPVARINTLKIEQKLSENQFISKATVYKTPSGKIKIEITQKKPLLRVFDAQGSYYIDELGQLMPANYRYAVHVPVACGAIEKSLAVADLYKFALFLQRHKFWNNQIEQIYIHPDSEVELIPRVGNHRILLGDFDDYAEKMNNLQLFYEQAIPKVGWEKYDVINLKYKNQIVCTKK